MKCTGYADEDVAIDFEDLEWDATGHPIRSRLTYTDLTGLLSRHEVREFALAEMLHEGWPVLRIESDLDRRAVVIEVGDIGPEFDALAS